MKLRPHLAGHPGAGVAGGGRGVAVVRGGPFYGMRCWGRGSVSPEIKGRGELDERGGGLQRCRSGYRYKVMEDGRVQEVSRGDTSLCGATASMKSEPAGPGGPRVFPAVIAGVLCGRRPAAGYPVRSQESGR